MIKITWNYKLVTKALKNCSNIKIFRYYGAQLPNEDEEIKEKFIHDLRNIQSTRAVYAAGLASTGSFGSPNLIMRRTSPEVVYKPLRISFFNSKKIRKVSAGLGFSLFATSTMLYGTGLNNFYQIGGPFRKSDKEDENLEWYIHPRRIMLPEDCGKIIDISSGRLHSLIATTSGLYALGDNSHGQCGLDPEKHPLVTYNKKFQWEKIVIPSNSTIKAINCTLDSSFVLLENGELYSFGLGTDGQLGYGNKIAEWKPTLVEGDLKGEKIVRIAGKTDTLLAVSKNGDLFAWGQNEYNQIPTSPDPQLFYATYLPFKNIGKITAAAATGSSCIICNSDGNVFTWGSSVLGFGPKVEAVDRPMQLNSPLFASAVGDDGKVIYVYAGNCMMAALTEPGHLFTWGSNQHGSLGIGHLNHQFFPYQVYLPYPLKTASFGPDHSLFLTQ